MASLVTGTVAAAPAIAAAVFGASAGVTDAADVLRVAGNTAGVAGLAWLLLAMLLSIRVPGFDRPFGGLLRLWRVHHWLGAGSFVLVMLHPVLLSLAAAPDGPDVVLAVLVPPLAAWPIWSGWLALLAMTVFLAPTFSFFGEPHYQRWKHLHRLSALAAVLALAHAVPLARSLPAGSWVWVPLGALALFAFLWRLLLSRWLSRRSYGIAGVRHLAAGVVELTLEGPPLGYRPGQFVYLAPHDPALAAGRGEEHPYALVSAPQEPHLRVAIKDLGDASHALMHVAEGSRVSVEGPYGAFLPARHDCPALWIGGGIGITPFVSAARAFAHGDEVRDVHLIYCANDPSRVYYLEELERIAAGCPGFAVHAHYFVEQGPLAAEFLRAAVPDPSSRDVYACGPAPLLSLVRALLSAIGVSPRRIHTEEFELL